MVQHAEFKQFAQRILSSYDRDIQETRGEIYQAKSELQGEIQQARADLTCELTLQREETRHQHEEVRQVTEEVRQDMQGVRHEVKEHKNCLQNLILKANKYYQPQNVDAATSLLLLWAAGFTLEVPDGSPNPYPFAFPVTLPGEHKGDPRDRQVVVILPKAWYLFWSFNSPHQVSMTRFMAALNVIFPQHKMYTSKPNRKLARELVGRRWMAKPPNTRKAIPPYLVVPLTVMLEELDKLAKVVSEVRVLRSYFGEADSPQEVYEYLHRKRKDYRYKKEWVGITPWTRKGLLSLGTVQSSMFPSLASQARRCPEELSTSALRDLAGPYKQLRESFGWLHDFAAPHGDHVGLFGVGHDSDPGSDSEQDIEGEEVITE